MFMPKQPVSVTLDSVNLLWLKARAAGRKKRSLSDALDEILTQARRGGHGADTPRSVVGTIDVAASDPSLVRADEAVRAMFATSLSQPFLVRETVPAGTSAVRRSARRKASGG